jgi:hypothetical protein
LLEGFLNIFLHGLLLWDGKGIDLAMGHWLTRKKVYGTIPGSVRWKLGGLLGTENITERLVTGGDIY